MKRRKVMARRPPGSSPIHSPSTQFLAEPAHRWDAGWQVWNYGNSISRNGMWPPSGGIETLDQQDNKKGDEGRGQHAAGDEEARKKPGRHERLRALCRDNGKVAQ